jgi:Ser/Thr protein kinase RdoA (MazF antagonist)
MTHEATDLFLSLTPERVLDAVEAADLRCRPMCYPLNSFENRVYEVELDDRTRVIAKFYRPGRWSAEQILEEHAFLSDLADAELPVTATRPFPDGETLKQIDNIYYACSSDGVAARPTSLPTQASVWVCCWVGCTHRARGQPPPLD